MVISKKDVNSVKIASETLKEGKVCIVPTDTVYGFSGIVETGDKVTYNTDAAIGKIKGRDENKPLIQLIARPEDIFLYTEDKIPQELLVKWPGALTIIVNVKKSCSLYERYKTIAFRCPGDEWLRQVILQCGTPIYSTSVNRSGQPVLEEQKAICDEFEKEAALIVTDGDKKGAKPSTLVKLEDGAVKVLRQGDVLV